jgi:hypothetical protein
VRYWNLNIRHDFFAAKSRYEGAAFYWLDERKEAPIFYSDLTLQDIRTESVRFNGWGNSRSEIKSFYRIGAAPLSEQRENVFVTIDEGWVWIYQVCGEIREAEDEKHPAEFLGQKVTGIPKSVPLQLLARKHVKDVPLVLSSMKSNQWMTRGTFREIERERPGSYIGNIAAIQSILNRWEDNFFVDPLSCISSLEFETLIAKIFEEMGCFVPAYKGGFLRDIDLICKPTQSVKLHGIELEQASTYAWQLKLQVSKGDKKQIGKLGSFVICLNSDKNLDTLFPETDLRARVFGRDWLRSLLSRSPNALNWLEQSLSWLPRARRSAAVAT